jgi:7,8-dihydropterin-6-yl-methyl-4-(beta-D-ribofuranosyl)aminobenzene 5'-phosphate synthase
MLIETDKGQRVLVDTGASEEVLLHNLSLLGLSVDKIDAVFITHGHYDHAGGLAAFAKVGVPIFMHPKALVRPRFAVNNEKMIDISIPERVAESLATCNIKFVSTMTEIVEGVRASGEITRQFPFEAPGNYVIKQGENLVGDNFNDEQVLYVSSRKGLIIVVGCGHAGIVNIVHQAKKSTGSKIFMIAGGFHLYCGDTDRLLKTMDHLKNLGVERVVPMHCTGFEAMKLISDRFTGFELMSVGSEIVV